MFHVWCLHMWIIALFSHMFVYGLMSAKQQAFTERGQCHCWSMSGSSYTHSHQHRRAIPFQSQSKATKGNAKCLETHDLRKANQCVKTHAFRSRPPPSLCLPQVQPSQQSSSLAIAQVALAPAVCQLTTFGKQPLFLGGVRIRKTP